MKVGQAGVKKGKPTASFVVSVGSVSVPVYSRRRSVAGRAYTGFTLSFYDAEGRRVRRSFADAGEAKAEAQRVAAGLAAGRQESARLTASEAETFLAASKKVAPTGFSLLAALDEWLAARAALPHGSGLMDAVSYFASRHPANAPSRVVEEVVAEFLADRERAGVSRHYLRDIRCRLGRVSESFRNCPIASLTPALVGTYLASELADQTNRSRRNVLRLISGLFQFARRAGYVSRALAEEIAEIPAPKAETVETEVFTVDEMRRLLDSARPEIVPALAIGGFAGLRSEEIIRLDWSEVKLGEGVIVVSAGKAKTASRRIVPIQPNLRAWLELAAKASGPVVPPSPGGQVLQNAMRLTAERAGIQWVRNGLRHSFCSYRVAVTGDPASVATEAGNSAGMIHKHYRALVTAAEGAAWFAIQPDR